MPEFWFLSTKRWGEPILLYLSTNVICSVAENFIMYQKKYHESRRCNCFEILISVIAIASLFDPILIYFMTKRISNCVITLSYCKYFPRRIYYKCLFFSSDIAFLKFTQQTQHSIHFLFGLELFSHVSFITNLREGTQSFITN